MQNKFILNLMYFFNLLMFLFLPSLNILGEYTNIAWCISTGCWLTFAIIMTWRLLR